jgi:hypothetical protein
MRSGAALAAKVGAVNASVAAAAIASASVFMVHSSWGVEKSG